MPVPLLLAVGDFVANGYIPGVGRTVPSIAAGLGLISVAIGGLAMLFSRRGLATLDN